MFQKGLVYGFFPEIVLEKDEKIKLEFLQNYSDLIFYKDIIERYSFKNVKKIKLFKKLLISYMWDFINYSKLAEILTVEYNTILSWLDAFVDSYFVFELKNFDLSVRKQLKSFSKVFIIDNWFYTLNFKHYKQDFWKLFENFVFLELRKQWFKENENIFYFKKWKYDVDFLLMLDKPYLINVVYQLTETNFEREVEKLNQVCEEFDVNWILIYFENYTKFDKYENVEFIPFYKINEFLSNLKL